MKSKMKRIWSGLLAVIMIITVVIQPMDVKAATAYNPTAAVTWAYDHYKSSNEICAGFVSDCLINGAKLKITKRRGVGELAAELPKAGFTAMKLKESSPGVMKYSANADKLAVGDVLIWTVPDGWFNGKKTVHWLHAALVTGRSSKDEILVTQTNGKVKDSTANYYYWDNTKKGKVCNYIVYSYHYTGKIENVKSPTIKTSNVAGGKKVTITGETGNTIYYSIDGGSYSKYTTPITLTKSKSYKISAYALNSNGTPSAYVSQSFSISKVAKPVISSTRSGSNIHISISDATVGSSIEYSIDNKNWYIYKNTITISESSTVYARAKLNGYENSDTASQAFTIEEPTAPNVTIKNGKTKVGIDEMITLEWKKIAQADYYTVKLTAPDGTSQTKDVYGTSYAAKLSKNGDYTIEVAAVNGCGTATSEKLTVTVMPNVTVQFVDDEGKALSEVYSIPYGGSVEAPKAPSKEGYDFQRWDGNYTNVTENTTIKAVFSIKTYTVTFKNSDGTILSEQKKVPWGTAATEPDVTGSAPTGYAFAGWNVEAKSECSDYKKVTGNMVLYAVYRWANADLPVAVTNFSVKCENTGSGQSYVASLKLTCNPNEDTKGRIVFVIETAKGTTVAVENQDVTLTKNSTQDVKITLNSSAEGTKASVYVVGLDDNKTGGAYSEKVSTDVTREIYYSEWTEWTDVKPEEQEGVQVESRTLYRYNTRKTATSTTSKTLSGYDYISTKASTGNWSSWQDTKVNTVNTDALKREVRTQTIVTSTKYTYGHYCTGNVSGAKYQTSSSNNTSNATFNSNCKYHEIGTFDSTSSLITACSDGVGYQYVPSGSSSKYRCANTCYRWYRLKTTQTTKTQYQYRDTTYVHSFEKISDYTDWSTVEPASGSYYKKEEKIQYRTRNILSTGEVTEKDTDAATITGSVDAKENLQGKKATVLVYKKSNTDPTESQLEYVDQIEIGADNSFEFDMRSREALSGETGDFVVSFAIEGATRLVNVLVIDAPKPSYKVTFSCDGQVIATQDVPEHGNATLPTPTVINGKEFVRWDVSTSNVTQNLYVEAIYKAKQNVIVFVDYLNGTAEITYADYGSTISRKLPEAPEGYIFTGWDIKDTEVVTQDRVVEALYKKKTYTVVFLDANGNQVGESQSVAYGESATAPDLSSLSAPVGVSVLGWGRDGEWRCVKEDMVVSPILSYAETVGEPYLYENPENPAQAILESETEGATIFYTLDGSEPSLEGETMALSMSTATTYVYNAPFTVTDGTTVRAIAVKDGMNCSETSVIAVTDADEEYEESVVGLPLEEENASTPVPTPNEGTSTKEDSTTAVTPQKGTALEVGNVKYKVKDAGGTQVTVTKIKNNKATSITIPDTVTTNHVTLKVTSIDASAFKNCSKLKTITIGKNINTIGKNAFYGCKNLTTIKGGTNITVISQNAFYGCKGLKKVTLNSLKLTKIDASAFKNCTNLTNITVKSKNLTTIGKNAFYGDKKLAKVTLKTTKLKTVGKAAFKGIKSKAKFSVPKKYVTKYKKLLKKSGIGKKMKVTK